MKFPINIYIFLLNKENNIGKNYLEIIKISIFFPIFFQYLFSHLSVLILHFRLKKITISN